MVIFFSGDAMVIFFSGDMLQLVTVRYKKYHLMPSKVIFIVLWHQQKNPVMNVVLNEHVV